MNTHRPLFTALGLLIAAVILGGLLWSSNGPQGSVAVAEQAQIAGKPADPLPPAIPAKQADPVAQTNAVAQAPPALTTTTIQVPISGIVGGGPERVALSGQAQIASRLVPADAPELGSSPPAVELTIDMSNVTGVGVATNTQYVVLSQEILSRRLGSSDLVEISFPFFPSGPQGMMAARTAMVSFNLSFNITTGVITRATAHIISS